MMACGGRRIVLNRSETIVAAILHGRATKCTRASSGGAGVRALNGDLQMIAMVPFARAGTGLR